MSKYTDSIKRIAKQDKPKGGLEDPIKRAPISGNVASMSSYIEPDPGAGLVSPVTLEMLTYDNAQDTIIQANNGDFTVKQVATARIIDADGTIIEIDTITYAPP